MASIWVKLAAASMSAALLTGCAGIRDHRGYVLDKELATNIQVGVDNKDSVTKALGRPSFTGQFDQNDWYYLARDTNTLPFRGPRVKEQTLLHVRFDAAGNVASVGQTGKDQIVSINPVNDKTPTLGRKRSFFDELFGNIGVLNSGALGQTSPDN
ncbi:outer membrane protein assembly factor BamE [Sphingomonas sp.]|uniref:outer membrane protein assembly factor BamE n=1 Tax=Sphingomonas sp. TaxID=28214 RepID=UPI00286C8639|nr:outer membrane protein assembly factor BamE [Sphingomonas sp.]